MKFPLHGDRFSLNWKCSLSPDHKHPPIYTLTAPQKDGSLCLHKKANAKPFLQEKKKKILFTPSVLRRSEIRAQGVLGPCLAQVLMRVGCHFRRGKQKQPFYMHTAMPWESRWGTLCGWILCCAEMKSNSFCWRKPVRSGSQVLTVKGIHVTKNNNTSNDITQMESGKENHKASLNRPLFTRTYNFQALSYS